MVVVMLALFWQPPKGNSPEFCILVCFSGDGGVHGGFDLDFDPQPYIVLYP